MNEMPEADRANAYAKRRSKVFGLEDPNKAGCGQYTHTQILLWLDSAYQIISARYIRLFMIVSNYSMSYHVLTRLLTWSSCPGRYWRPFFLGIFPLPKVAK